MRFVYILFYLLYSLLYYDHTNMPCYICGIHHTRGKELRKYWHKDLSQKRTRNPMNGGGQGF